MPPVASSTSTNRGRAPAWATASAEAVKVWATVTTSSPGPTPSAARARWIAAVPEATPTARRAPQNPANAASNAATSGPRMNPPDPHHPGHGRVQLGPLGQVGRPHVDQRDSVGHLGLLGSVADLPGMVAPRPVAVRSTPAARGLGSRQAAGRRRPWRTGRACGWSGTGR